MKDRVYLDWNATAPLRTEARAAMAAAMDVAGNPSSVHAEGRAARALVERARADIAEALGAGAAEIVFTSGATEAAGLAAATFHAGIGASDIEHDCVLSVRRNACGAVARDGRLSLPAMELSRGTDPAYAVAHQAANGETGVVQDWAGHAAELAGLGVHGLCDAVQAVGKLPFAFDWSGIDAALVSAHKIGGPKGVGALVVKKGIDVRPLITGGGQEQGRRSGTENVIGIAGFAAAAKAAVAELARGVWDEVAERRARFEAAIRDALPDAVIAGEGAARLPNTSCILVPGWKGETQVMQLDLAGFAISAGSACSSGKVRPSRVLRAMGYDETEAASAIRVSAGPATTEAELMDFAVAWAAAYRRHRARAA